MHLMCVNECVLKVCVYVFDESVFVLFDESVCVCVYLCVNECVVVFTNT